MTKEEIISRISDECNVSRPTARQMFETAIYTIRESCQSGESVTLRGFGTFKVVVKAAKKARNIKTGESVLVAAHKAVKFKPAPEFTNGMCKL